jgi:RNA polymerase sigma-70 factor, ECF subfamily
LQLAVRERDDDRIEAESEEMKDAAEDLARARFETAVLPHLSSAYNLARWLTRGDADAQDIVQEAILRAWKFFGGYRGGDGRSWLLAIVRNCCATWRDRNRFADSATPFDEERHTAEEDSRDPEALATIRIDLQRLRSALEGLAPHLREVMILREQEGFSYKEIASIVGAPIGTVMSRLARARSRLLRILAGEGESGT